MISNRPEYRCPIPDIDTGVDQHHRLGQGELTGAEKTECGTDRFLGIPLLDGDYQ